MTIKRDGTLWYVYQDGYKCVAVVQSLDRAKAIANFYAVRKAYQH